MYRQGVYSLQNMKEKMNVESILLIMKGISIVLRYFNIDQKQDTI